MPSWQDITAEARATRYAAIKDTHRHKQAEAKKQRDATDKIVAMGYTRGRAARAVRDYANAARDTPTGPDWPGFLDMVKTAGLVE